MRKTLLILCLCFPVAFAAAQGINTHNDHTGSWSDRASWSQSWEGILTTNPLPAAQVGIYGYVALGILSAPQILELDNSLSSSLTVHDTLRIHGNLRVGANAALTIEANGVLIVNGNYEQYSGGTLNNKGKFVVEDNFSIASDGGLSQNTGHIYAGGSVELGGANLTIKTLTTLASEDAHTSFFSTTNVINRGCAGNNSGTLNFSGTNNSVAHWESSTDYFQNNIQTIANNTSQYNYSNLQRTTSFRVYYRSIGGNYTYSNGATVLIAQTPVGGTISGASEFCGTASSVTLSLQNHTANVKHWEWSTDNFATAPQTQITSSESISLANLTATTYVRALVSGCKDVYSQTFTITVNEVSQGGTITGAAAVCKGTNTGSLRLENYLGNILRWELSADNFVADVRPVENTTAAFNFSDLSSNTWYRAVVQNGNCAAAYSNSFKVTVSELAGGTLTGPGGVCAGSNSGTLQIQDYSGNLIRGEWSHDGFQNHVEVSAYDQDTYTFSNLTQDTWYRAVIGNAECGEIYSTEHVVRADQPSLGGTISGPGSVCTGTNSVALTLSGYRGQVLNWEYSSDSFVTHSQPIDNTNATLSISNLISTGWYRAVVKNGACSQVYSDKFKVTVTEVAGGALSGPAEVCEASNSGTLTLDSYMGNIIRWEWSNNAFQTHVQTIAHTQATYNFSNLTGDTWYRAVVGNSDCGEQNSSVFVVRFDALSHGGTISGTASVCKGTNTGTLRLSGHRGQILRWEYSTDGFVSHIQAVANTSSTHTFSNLSSRRWYRAVVQNGSCSIAYSPLFEIVVSEIAGGELTGASSVCQSNASGELSLQNYTGNIIRWESSTDNFGSNTQPISITTPQLTFTDLSSETWFRVVVGNSDCGETLSAVWKVALEAPSLGGNLSGAQTFCSSQNGGTLQLQNQRGQVLRWESSADNFVQEVQPLAGTGTTYTYSNLAATTYFRAVVQNQSCSPAYSSIVAITLAAPSQAGALEGAATVCKGQNSGILSLQSKVGDIIGWESSTDNFATITSIAHTGNNLSYQDLTATTAYRAVVQNSTCNPVYSQIATITVSPEVVAGQVAGSLTVVTGTNTGEVALQGAAGPVLYWESSTDEFVNQITTLNNTTTTQRYAGLNQTSWYRAAVQNSDCGVVFASPAKITVNHAPLAQADTLLVPEALYTMPVSVLQNDTDPDGNTLRVVPAEGPTTAGGFASMAADGILYYEAPENYLGYDAFAYTVCDDVNGAELCDEAAIVLDVRLPAPALIVYQGVSPNGDAHNDYWRIEYIERYPNNIVQLYDRLGVLVYEQRAYNNAERAFIGQGNKGVRPGGNELPEGTYFYKIITSDQAPVLQGYIVLKK